LDNLSQLLSTEGTTSEKVRAFLAEAKQRGGEWYEIAKTAVELRVAAEEEGRTGERPQEGKPSGLSLSTRGRESSVVLPALLLGAVAGVILLALLRLQRPDSSQQELSSDQIADRVLDKMEKPLQKQLETAVAQSDALKQLPDRVTALKGEVTAAIDAAVVKSSNAIKEQLHQTIADEISKSKALNNLPKTVAAAVGEQLKKDIATSLDEKRLSERIVAKLKDDLIKEVAEAVTKAPAVADLPKRVAKEFEGRLKTDLLAEMRQAISDQFVREYRSLFDERTALRSVVFSSAGGEAFSIARDGTAKLWVLKGRFSLATYPGAKYQINSAAFSPDGRQAVLGSQDGSVLLLDNLGGSKPELPKLIGRHDRAVFTVAFSPSDRVAVSGSADGTARVWDLRERRERGRFTRHRGSVLAVRFSTKGNYVVSGGADNTVRRWNVESQEEVRAYQGHKEAVLDVALASEDSRIISVGADRSVRLWNAESGDLIKTMEDPRGFTSLGVNQEAGIFACGRRDHTVQVWETKTGESVRSFPGAGGLVVGLSFLKKPEVLLTASSNGAVVGWNLKTGKEEPGLSFPLISGSRSLPRDE